MLSKGAFWDTNWHMIGSQKSYKWHRNVFHSNPGEVEILLIIVR